MFEGAQFAAVTWWMALALVALAALLGAVAALKIRRWWRRRVLWQRGRRARAGERRAIDLLERHGYRLLGEQQTHGYRFWVGEQPVYVTVRADLLVERQGRCYVVEVKTGAAANPTAVATRRQLLEYAHAFGVDGLLLADMQAERLLSISFHPPAGHSESRAA